MPKGKAYTTNVRLTPPKKEVHPVWRGVGFVFMIFIPIISISLAILLVDGNTENKWFEIPSDIMVKAKDPTILVKAILTVLFILILYAIFTMITFITNRLFGPPRYGPYDLPSAKFKRIKR